MAEKASYHKAKISGQAGERHMERDFDDYYKSYCLIFGQREQVLARLLLRFFQGLMKRHIKCMK